MPSGDDPANGSGLVAIIGNDAELQALVEAVRRGQDRTLASLLAASDHDRLVQTCATIGDAIRPAIRRLLRGTEPLVIRFAGQVLARMDTAAASQDVSPAAPAAPRVPTPRPLPNDTATLKRMLLEVGPSISALGHSFAQAPQTQPLLLELIVEEGAI
jgi:hypothetical protein